MAVMTPPSKELQRDFLFSTILDGLNTMSRGVLSSQETQELLTRLTQFKALFTDDEKMASVLSDDEVIRRATIEELTEGSRTGTQFFNKAAKKALSPSQDLLVRNRFIVALRDRIEDALGNAILQKTLTIASWYFYEDTVSPKAIYDAAATASGHMAMNYHPQYVPSIPAISTILSEVLETALADHANAPEERVIPDPYDPDRLEGLEVNL